MKREGLMVYEKPQLETYRFGEKVAVGSTPTQGGDIDEGCDSPGFDDD